MPELELTFIKKELFNSIIKKAERVKRNPSKENLCVQYQDIIEAYNIEEIEHLEVKDLSKCDDLAYVLIHLTQKICGSTVFDESDLVELLWEYGDGEISEPIIENFFKMYPRIEDNLGFGAFCKITNTHRGTFGSSFPFGTGLDHCVDDGVLTPKEVSDLKSILPILEEYRQELPDGYTFTSQWEKLIKIIRSLECPFPYIYMICYP